MRKKIKENNKQKNSKPVIKEKETSTTNFVITPETSAIVTIHERGAVKNPDFINSPKSKTIYHNVLIKTKLTPEAVQYFISEDGNPNRTKYSKFMWNKMSKKQKLEANLAYTAGDNKYEYVLIN